MKTQNHNKDNPNDTKFKNIPAAIKVAPATSFDKCNLSQMTSKTGTKKSSQIAPSAKIRYVAMRT